MTNHQTHQYEMLTRVKTFGDEHGERVARSPLARAQFAIIETAVTRLTNHAVAKLAAARVTGAAKRAARLALVDALSAIARTARTMGPALTGMRHTFRMPSPRPDRALITAGQLVAREAEGLAASSSRLACRLRSSRTCVSGPNGSRTCSASGRRRRPTLRGRVTRSARS